MIEYFLQNMWQVWAIIAVLCLILELSSGDFFIICFSIGAVFAIIGAVLGLNVYWQLAIFALFTTLSAQERTQQTQQCRRVVRSYRTSDGAYHG